MTIKEIIEELESIEDSLRYNDIEEASLDLHLLLKELLKSVTIEEIKDEEKFIGIEIGAA
mgnify:CR=1 FL=1|tara:strand:- start:223 stop:402 length:180 start_codon:yes stop_codon:yes gene_type:complete